MEATFDLLATAHAAGPYDRYLLISDDTAPLLAPDSLVATLVPFEDRIPIAMNPPDWVQRRYRNYLYFDHPALSPRTATPEDRGLDASLLAVVEEAANLWKTTGKKPVALGHGSAWWSLTKETVDFLLNQYNDDNWARTSFKFSCNPDEQYIQTMIGKPNDARFMFTDFSRDPKPFVFRTLDEINGSVLPGYLFIRKVDPAVPAIADLMRTGRLAP